MQVLIFINLIIWVYIISVLIRAKLYFFKFLVGAVGAFFFMMVFLQQHFIGVLTTSLTAVCGVIGDVTGYFKAYSEYGLIFISTANSSVSMYIDYECCGVIEIFAFAALLWFFPLYNVLEKIMYTIGGILWIFAANVLRVVIICVVVHHYGDSMFYFAHTIFGRMVFYILSIVLYFYVFTKSQIRRQKVGNVSYEYAPK